VVTAPDSPPDSTVHLEIEHAEERAQDKWDEMRPKLERMKSTDSVADLKSKKDNNMKCLLECERYNGLSNLATLMVVRQMADDAFETQRYEEADALYKRLFVAVQETYTPCSEKVVEVLKLMAEVGRCQYRLVEATKMLQRARTIQNDLKLDDSSPEVLDIKERMAKLYDSQGFYSEALGEIRFVIREHGKEDLEALRLNELEEAILRHQSKKSRYARALAESKSKKISEMRKALGMSLESASPRDSFHRRGSSACS